MFDVGCLTMKTFQGIFKKVTGFIPLHNRNKYDLES
jgi:hypothetical protein